MIFAALLLAASPQAEEIKSPPAATLDLFAPTEGQPHRGQWRAWLDSPGGELPFGLHIRVAVIDKEPRWVAELINGEERITVPSVSWHKGERQLVLDMPHYDSRITARVAEDGKRMDGRWRKRRGLDKWADMAFHATAMLEPGPATRFLPLPRLGESDPQAPPSILAKYWAIDFSSSEDQALGIFSQHQGELVTGTVLTTLGDYRYLAGRRDGDRLRLSCFDGAHAFLFDASLIDDGRLQGKFYSSDSWQEDWSAVEDQNLVMPDAFEEVKLAPGVDVEEPLPLDGLSFPDLDGVVRELADPELHGKVTIISLFGSWCPNCNDEAAFFAELDKRYHDRGLRFIGLGFELTGEQERDTEQLKRFRDRWDLRYPILLAGSANKKEAQLAFPLLKQVKSFPTALILDRAGKVRTIHSGFDGPATGIFHQYMRAKYEQTILELLTER